jgi:hypothetical protein
MHNQLLLFECEVLDTELRLVWEHVTPEQEETATRLLAALMARSVASERDGQASAEAGEASHE